MPSLSANSYHFVKKILLPVAFCLLILSCKTEEVYLYDKTGFSPERRYYTPYPNNAPTRYDSYGRPHSREYQNPYDFPPKKYYPYYDSDQYYVPPSYYHNIEAQEQFPYDSR